MTFEDGDVLEEDEEVDLEDLAWLYLPDSDEIHEWEIMRDFAASRGDPAHRDQSFEAIHGRGAFRMFRSTADRLRLTLCA